MGGFSLWHWIIVLVVVLLLFGRGRISDVMGDFGKGIKSFKQGLGEESATKPGAATPAAPPAQIPAAEPAPSAPATAADPAKTGE